MTVILQKRDEEKRGKRNNATKKKIFVRSDCAKKVDAPGRTVDSKRTKKMSEFSEQKKYQQLNERERGVLQLFFGLLSDVVTFELEAETKKIEVQNTNGKSALETTAATGATAIIKKRSEEDETRARRDESVLFDRSACAKIRCCCCFCPVGC